MKWKLIKEYPGSGKKGMIIYSNEYTHGHKYLNTKDYPEFWEEVIEKDYEILSLTFNNNIYYLTTEKSYYHNNDYKYKLKNQVGFLTLSAMYINNTVKIHSVKRLSDCEVFTVGDEISYSKKSIRDFGTSYIIKNFDILKYQQLSTKFENNGNTLYLTLDNKWNKLKTPLFKTEDGVDIFKNDIFYTIDSNFNIQKTFGGEDEVDNAWSSKEKAEEYVLMNKPCLSIYDVKSLNLKDSITKTEQYIESNLKNLVKEKIKNDSNS